LLDATKLFLLLGHYFNKILKQSELLSMCIQRIQSLTVWITSLMTILLIYDYCQETIPQISE